MRKTPTTSSHLAARRSQAVPPGLLNRPFALIDKMKLSANYIEVIGTDLGIVGSEALEKALPRFAAEVEQGSTCQYLPLRFYIYGHMSVYLESPRGTSAWQFLAIDTESPNVDERPLLVAGTPEVRECRLRFWDKGTPNGDWTDVVKPRQAELQIPRNVHFQASGSSMMAKQVAGRIRAALTLAGSGRFFHDSGIR